MRLLFLDGHFHFAERLSPLRVNFFFSFKKKKTSSTVQKEVNIGRLSYICHQMRGNNETNEGLNGFKIYSPSPNYFTPSGA